MVQWTISSDERREPKRAAFCKPVLLPMFLALAGCAGPLSQTEAVRIAGRSLTKFCRDRSDCRPVRFAHAQRLKDRWLIEYDSPANVFGVAVEEDGNTDVSVWDKKSGSGPR